MRTEQKVMYVVILCLLVIIAVLADAVRQRTVRVEELEANQVTDSILPVIGDSVWNALMANYSGVAGSFGDSSKYWNPLSDSVWLSILANYDRTAGSFGDFLEGGE